MTWSEIGEPLPSLRHGSERACHEGDCTRCRQDQERAEREEGFWSRIATGDTTKCWPWLGRLESSGYGQLRWEGTTRMAHRVAYELVRGPIPDGLQLDHLCRTRACCNPAHLEPVTHRENVLRGIGPTAVNAAKTECDYGHPLSGDNLMLRDDGRQCRACVRRRGRDRQRRYRARLKAAMAS